MTKKITALLILAGLAAVLLNLRGATYHAFPTPTAAGVDYVRTRQAEIDYSHAHYGYVMVRWHNPDTAQARVRIDNPAGAHYVYRLSTRGHWEVFPLTGGDGPYLVRVLEPVDTRWAVAATAQVDVVLAYEFAPFLRPNQFVNFGPDSAVAALAQELTAQAHGVLETVSEVYHWVISHITYDFDLAQRVTSGQVTYHIPHLDTILYTRQGICFDYAALMTAMLRSLGIPTRLVFGFAGDAYHAWLDVYSPEYGWLSHIIFLRNNTWNLMDPTFAATSHYSEAFQQFFGDGSNYHPTSLH